MADPRPSDSPQRTRDLTLLWTRAQPVVRPFLHSLVRDANLVDDLLQQVALVVVEKFDELESHAKFNAWAMGIARNLVLNQRRVAGRSKLTFSSEAIANLAAAHEKLGETAEAQRGALNHCLQKLDDRARRVIDLRYRDDRAVDAIAAAIGSTANGVYLLLSRSRRVLLECIDRRLSADAREDAR